MNLILTRIHADENGVFGDLYSENGTIIACTAEHAYLQPDGSYAAKMPVGSYVCQRGIHILGSGEKIETFQIMDVPEHSGILIHPGNYPQVDSDGCVLLGQQFDAPQEKAVLNSREAFARFMQIEFGVTSFQLTVSNRVSLGNE